MFTGLALMWPPAARATVYTLRPGVRARELEAVLKSKPVLSDRIVINGHKGQLDVFLLDHRLQELPAVLSRYVKGLQVDVRPSSLLIEAPGAGGRLLRYYILSMGQGYQTLMFRMDIPEEVRNAEVSWPADLPRLRGATPEQVMQLTGRRMLYASFRVARPVAAARSGYHALLQEDGWQLLGTQPSTGVYTRRRDMLFLNVSQAAAGDSLVTLCRKRLDTEALPQSR
jgi:hypothetical protein